MSTILPINIDDLLHHRGVESSRVEFKKSWNEGPTGLQVLHTICAFANDLQNLNGGYIIIGVEEENGMAKLPPAGLTPGELAKAQTWIRGHCNTLDPVYQPTFSPEVVEGKHILVLWAPGSDTRPHQAPEGLEKSARKYWVRISSDTIEAKGAILTQLIQLTARVPFDDRRALSVPVEKIRETKVKEFLVDIRSGLLVEQDAREIYRRMQITSPINGHEVPRNIALLLFSEDPEEWFRGAHVEVVQFAGDISGNVIEEKAFRGPLQQQIRDCLAYLRTFSTQHLEKLGDRPEVKGWVSYPFPAMEESIVNALYHRSYEGEPEPTKIYLYPDRMEIISYPGPVRGIERNHLQPGGSIPPVPARNRRIGEFLKELRLAEGRGTGIPKVFRVMEQNGSPLPRFDFDDDRTYFRAILPAHPEYLAISALRDAAHLRAIGDEASARMRLRQALSELPGSGTLAAALIEDLARTGDLEAARKTFGHFMATAHSDNAPRAVMAMSGAYLNANRLQEAKAVLDRLPSLLAPQEAFEAAILERRAGRHDRAHRYFERTGDAAFHDVKALHEYAQAKIRLAQDAPHARPRAFSQDARRRLLREAREMLQRVLQMDAPPTRHAWAWFDLGRVLRWLKAPVSEIRNAFNKAHQLIPDEERFQHALEELEERPQR